MVGEKRAGLASLHRQRPSDSYWKRASFALLRYCFGREQENFSEVRTGAGGAAFGRFDEQCGDVVRSARVVQTGERTLARSGSSWVRVKCHLVFVARFVERLQQAKEKLHGNTVNQMQRAVYFLLNKISGFCVRAWPSLWSYFHTPRYSCNFV